MSPRIVMVTAFGREEVRAQAEKIGIDAYLNKPVNASVLYDTLMDLFGRDSERRRPIPPREQRSRYSRRGACVPAGRRQRHEPAGGDGTARIAPGQRSRLPTMAELR